MTLLVLARTIYGEARGETLDGKIAVAWIIRNRVKRAGWWGGTYTEVCLHPKQFSCWNDDQELRKNRIAMLDAVEDDLLECLYVAAGVITGDIPDPTGGSCHYHASNVHPKWAEGHTSHATIGHHLFYNDIP